MTFLRDATPPAAFEPFARFKEQLGFVPRILRAQALLPRVIEAETGVVGAVLLTEHRLTRVEKEALLVAVAAARRNTYCATLHSEILLLFGLGEPAVEGIATDFRRAALPERLLALLDFGTKLSATPTRISRRDVDVLRAHGLADEEILETVAVTALAEFLCCLSVGLGVTPDFPPRVTNSAGPPLSPVDLSSSSLEGAAGPYLRSEPLSDATLPPFAFFREKFGFVPNLFRAQTLRPDLIVAEVEMIRAVLLPDDVLSRVRKEFILLAVSAANLNTYCVAVHCEMLRALGVAPEQSERIAVNHHRAGLESRDAALLDFALKLARRPADYGRSDVDRLRSSGFTDAEILEAIVMTSLTMFLNTLQMGLGTAPDFALPAAFRPAAPATPEGRGEHPTQVPASRADGDGALVRRAQGGDLDAFEELVRRHHARVYRTLIGLTGTPEDAEDDLQVAFLKAYQHLKDFHGRSSFSTWLTRIAINESLQRLRVRKPAAVLDESLPERASLRPHEIEAWDDNPEQRYSRAELRELVEQEILKLPAIYRTALMMRDIEQLSTEEAVAALGIPETTLKSRLHHGRLLLREALAPHFSRSPRGSHV